MWKLFMLMLFITACKAIPPGLGESSGDAYFYVRSVKITCADTVEICDDRSANNLDAVVMYTTDLCQDFTDSSPVVALGASKVLCNDQNCISNIVTFKNGESPLESLPSGSYSLVSFIDVNANSLPDSDEPYLCAHDVQISALKNSTRIEVVMVKLKSESIAVDDD